MPLAIPQDLATTCREAPERMDWLRSLPDAVHDLERRWCLTLDKPFNRVSCSWVAPATCADGTSAVLKLGMPHLEGEHELDGLRFWDGNPTVRLLEGDTELNALLLERCLPGSSLREMPEPEQDVVISRLLRRLWRIPAATYPFRPLEVMTAYWSERTLLEIGRSSDAGIVREGLRLFEELPRTSAANVLLATDLHADNVLRAEREPWLVIDPKPFLGDPAYDATQHLLNCETRLRSDPDGTIRRFSDLLGLDPMRVRLWTFARLAAEWRGWTNAHDQLELARRLAP